MLKFNLKFQSIVPKKTIFKFFLEEVQVDTPFLIKKKEKKVDTPFGSFQNLLINARQIYKS